MCVFLPGVRVGDRGGYVGDPGCGVGGVVVDWGVRGGRLGV